MMAGENHIKLYNEMKKLCFIILAHTSTRKGSTGEMKENLLMHIKDNHVYKNFADFDRYCFEAGRARSAFVGLSSRKLDTILFLALWFNNANRDKITTWLASKSDRCAVVADLGEVVGYWRKPIITKKTLSNGHSEMSVQDNIKECTFVKVGLTKVTDGNGKEIVVVSTIFPMPEEYARKCA